MSKFTKRLIAVGFLLFLFLPLLGRIYGVEPQQLENRPLAQRPAFSPSSLFDTDFYKSVTVYLVDTLPWRKVAVAAAAWLSLEIFNDSPSPRVHVGRENWLFFDDALRMPCKNNVPLSDILGSLNRFATAIEESGREFHFLITPNKSSIYGEYMNSTVRRLEACAREKRAVLRSRLERQGPRGYINLFALLERSKRERPEVLYFSNDSHLNSFGSALQTAAIIESVLPGLWDSTVIPRAKKRPHTGDLTRIMGFPSAIRANWYDLRHDGVQLVSEKTTTLSRAPPLRRYVSAANEAILIPGPTLVLHDSQLNLSIPMLRQYFTDVSFIHWNTFNPEVLRPLIADSSLVVLQVVERGFYNRMSYQIGAGGFLDSLEHVLAERPLESIRE